MPLKPCRRCNRLSEDSLCLYCQRTQESLRTARRATEEPWRAIYGTAEWKKAQSLCIQRDGGCKAIRDGKVCNSRSGLSAHHIKALSDGGSPYDLENLVALCLYCHPKIERERRNQLQTEKHNG